MSVFLYGVICNYTYVMIGFLSFSYFWDNMYCLLVVLRGFIVVVFKCFFILFFLDFISDDGGLVMGFMIGL